MDVVSSIKGAHLFRRLSVHLDSFNRQGGTSGFFHKRGGPLVASIPSHPTAHADNEEGVFDPRTGLFMIPLPLRYRKALRMARGGAIYSIDTCWAVKRRRGAGEMKLLLVLSASFLAIVDSAGMIVRCIAYSSISRLAVDLTSLAIFCSNESDCLLCLEPAALLRNVFLLRILAAATPSLCPCWRGGVSDRPPATLAALPSPCPHHPHDRAPWLANMRSSLSFAPALLGLPEELTRLHAVSFSAADPAAAAGIPLRHQSRLAVLSCPQCINWGSNVSSDAALASYDKESCFLFGRVIPLTVVEEGEIDASLMALSPPEAIQSFTLPATEDVVAAAKELPSGVQGTDAFSDNCRRVSLQGSPSPAATLPIASRRIDAYHVASPPGDTDGADASDAQHAESLDEATATAEHLAASEKLNAAEQRYWAAVTALTPVLPCVRDHIAQMSAV